MAGANYYDFKNGSAIEGLDFGRQLMQHAYHVKRVSLAEFWSKCLNRELPERVKELPAFMYMPTQNAEDVQAIWHTFTAGIATGRAKVLVFLFNSHDVRRRMEASWPTKVTLDGVYSLLLNSDSNYEMARLKLIKGRLTFFTYVVKEKRSPFMMEAGAQDLQREIDSLENQIDSTHTSTNGLSLNWKLSLPNNFNREGRCKWRIV